MNKKGFTLVEVIVSLALLSLIGVAVGISLNKIFKDQNVKNYDEYVEKIKSSALLYANNTVDIINKLNSNYSYTVVTIKELVDKGYINKNLTNPETKEKINQDDSVRIYYNEDYEMLIEYPYTEKDEIYLYTMNYSIKYKSDEQDLCYKGLDGPTLQLVKVNTNDAGNKYEVISLKSDNPETKKIMAYMEDGSLCYDPTTNKSKIDTSKIGTYKIRYEYTIDGTDVRTSSNKKIAERTITVKPSKPVVTFKIDYQKKSSDYNFNVYKAKLNLQASDEEGLKLKYCLVATGINETPNVTSCNGTSDTIQENKWINENSNKINKNDDIDINKLFALAESENKLNISVFVKNDFEEYTKENIEYKLTVEVTIVPNGGKYKNSSNETIEEIKYDTKLGSEMFNKSSYSISNGEFDGLNSNKNGKGTSYNKESIITHDLTLYVQWYKYCTNTYIKETVCSEECGGGYKINKRYDSRSKNKYCRDEETTETCNTQKCYTTCDEVDITKKCEQYSDWLPHYRAYKYDKYDKTFCGSYWTEEECSLDGGSSGGSSSGKNCACRNAAQYAGSCECWSTGDPGTSGYVETSWFDNNTKEWMCCCVPAGCV